MDPTIQIRGLRANELSSTDAIYDELRFARSDPKCTRMVGAFQDDRVIGLGRLVDLGVHAEDQHFELGGMWVAPLARRSGLAGEIIRTLLDWVSTEDALWCTPFEDLMPLYGPHGFRIEPAEKAPPALLARLGRCASAQDRPVVVTRWEGHG